MRWYKYIYLFTVYVDDLSNTLNNAGIGCHVNNFCTNHVFYADDLCVIAPRLCGLQALLHILCSKYSVQNYTLYNPIRPICMVVKPHGYELKYPDVYLNNNKLEYVEKAKYLGVIICNDLKDDEAMLRPLRSS